MSIFYRQLLPLLSILLLAFSSCITPPKNEGNIELLNLSVPEDNLLGFAKIRGSLDSTEQVLFYWTGKAYSHIPGERSQLLFLLEGYNIAKLVPIDSGYQLLTRELMVYKDPKTQKILKTWENPFTGEDVEVLAVMNDPVNSIFKLKYGNRDWGLPFEYLGESRACFYTDILLHYPSPLPASEYPEHSRSEFFQANELFQFYFDLEEVSDPKVINASTQISWTRIGDWLPWMKMGDHKGSILYQCRGYKAKEGLSVLSSELYSFIHSEAELFSHPPDTFSSPNETSWTYFKKNISQ